MKKTVCVKCKKCNGKKYIREKSENDFDKPIDYYCSHCNEMYPSIMVNEILDHVDGQMKISLKNTFQVNLAIFLFILGFIELFIIPPAGIASIIIGIFLYFSAMRSEHKEQFKGSEKRVNTANSDYQINQYTKNNNTITHPNSGLKDDKIELALAYLSRGNDCFGQSNFDEAIYNFTKAIELIPYESAAYNGRGLCYYYRHDSYEDLKRSIADFTKVIEIMPDVDAYCNRGRAYM